MLENFFQIGPVPSNAMNGTYDLKLVVLSYLVATFASYIALDLTGRLRDVNNTRKGQWLWLAGGAMAMGSGIWSMHFIGMLAFTMPGMPMTYDFFWTSLSMLVAVLASGFALFVLKTPVIKPLHFICGGIILGLAIATMHYVGMQGMETKLDIHYLPGLFFLSIIIAILASEAALWLAIKSNQVIVRMRFRLKFISAFIMGAAICGMHYTGMAAAVLTPNTDTINLATEAGLDPSIMAMSIATVTFFILGIAVLVSTYKEAKNQQLLSMARQAGMAEVAASVLHNVGNVLNSVNVSANMVAETIEKSKLSELNDLSNLINEHKDNLSDFITKDPRASVIPGYITMLSQYWKKEQSLLLDETSTLIKNIEHIKNIISMQQSLTKVINIDQIVEINKILEEALMITGIETNHPDIKIIRNYKPLKALLIDKVKLLQILVNLLQNAKEALASTERKQLSLSIHLNGHNQFAIAIGDNGVGVPEKNLIKIFSYGFTTKEKGHGFGLHSSILAAKEMGGSLNAKSEGEGKGALFTLELPYKLPK